MKKYKKKKEGSQEGGRKKKSEKKDIKMPAVRQSQEGGREKKIRKKDININYITWKTSNLVIYRLSCTHTCSGKSQFIFQYLFYDRSYIFLVFFNVSHACIFCLDPSLLP